MNAWTVTPSPTPTPAPVDPSAVTEYALNASQFGVLGVGLALAIFCLAVIAIGVYRR